MYSQFFMQPCNVCLCIQWAVWKTKKRECRLIYTKSQLFNSFPREKRKIRTQFLSIIAELYQYDHFLVNQDILVCQPVLPHGLIRINIKIRSIIIIIHLTFFYLLNILTHTLKYIFSLFNYNRFHFVHLHIYSRYVQLNYLFVHWCSYLFPHT